MNHLSARGAETWRPPGISKVQLLCNIHQDEPWAWKPESCPGPVPGASALESRTTAAGLPPRGTRPQDPGSTPGGAGLYSRPSRCSLCLKNSRDDFLATTALSTDTSGHSSWMAHGPLCNWSSFLLFIISYRAAGTTSVLLLGEPGADLANAFNKRSRNKARASRS